MKLKYKKLIVLVSLGTMFLSFIILSMIPTGGDTPTSPEAKKLEQVTNEKITELISAYFRAKATVDMDAVSELVSDITQVPEAKWKAQAEIVEGYGNIVCHIIENEGQNAYRVYVQYDQKLINIATLAPSLTAFYVKLGSDDKYLVYLSALDEEEDEFIKSADKNIEVIKLMEDTKIRYEQAKDSDAALKKICEFMDNDITSVPVSQQAVTPQ